MFLGTPLFLNSRCSLSRRTRSTNAKNQQTYSAYALLASDVPCRMITKNRYLQQGEKWITIQESIFYFRFEQDISEDDSISFGGKTYIVNSVIPNLGNASHHVEAIAKEIT